MMLRTRFRLTLAPLVIIIGLLIFSAFFHLEVLDPTNVHWLLHLDWGHSFIGWEAFRHDVWRWPLGQEKLLDWPTGDNIVFTDSLPGLALVFKLLGALLPEPFQYIGPWLLFCVVMQVYFGFRLMRRYGSDEYAALIGGALVGLTPFFLARSYHNNLFGHWMLLWGLELFWFSSRDGRRAVGFTALLTVAVLTHFYLAVMVGALWSADIMREVWRRSFGAGRSQWTGFLLRTCLTPLPALIGMAACGYFNDRSPSYGGFSFYSTELLAWINPQVPGASIFLPAVKVREGGYEGLQYMGLGLLFVVAVGLTLHLTRRPEPKRLEGAAFLLPVLVVLVLYSLSDRIRVGSVLLVDLHYRNLIGPVAAVLRGNGRFLWPVSYVLIFAGLFSIVRLSRSTQLGILSFAILIQVVDLSGFARQQLSLTAAAATTKGLDRPMSPRWADLMAHARVIDYEPPDPFANLDPFYENAYRAVMIGRPITLMLDARPAPDQVAFQKADYKDFRAGRLQRDRLYVILSGCGPGDASPVYRLDGLGFVPPEGADTTGLAPDASPRQTVLLGQTLSFKNGQNPCLRGSGWSSEEPWGVWSDGSQADLFLPLPQNVTGPLVMTLDAHVYPPSGQEITVVAQGRQIARLKGPFPNEQTQFILPAALVMGRKRIDLAFQMKVLTSPEALGEGDDPRTLGLGLESVRLDRLN